MDADDYHAPVVLANTLTQAPFSDERDAWIQHTLTWFIHELWIEFLDRGKKISESVWTPEQLVEVLENLEPTRVLETKFSLILDVRKTCGLDTQFHATQRNENFGLGFLSVHMMQKYSLYLISALLEPPTFTGPSVFLLTNTYRFDAPDSSDAMTDGNSTPSTMYVRTNGQMHTTLHPTFPHARRIENYLYNLYLEFFTTFANILRGNAMAHSVLLYMLSTTITWDGIGGHGIVKFRLMRGDVCGTVFGHDTSIRSATIHAVDAGCRWVQLAYSPLRVTPISTMWVDWMFQKVRDTLAPPPTNAAESQASSGTVKINK
jgi:hypothetical protein